MSSHIDFLRRRFIGGALAIAAAPFVGSITAGARPAGNATVTQQVIPPYDGKAVAGFASASEWINSRPLGAAELRGKVVLVQFWTYTCINWLRTMPYVRAWSEKYKDQGLVVIGVHSPEFGFERNLDNIRQAARTLRVNYPIAVDSDHAIWRAFKNQYWPALYFIDAQGRIRHSDFGEGEYDKSEKVIQLLLAEAGATNVHPGLVLGDGRGIEASADRNDLRSAETYLGYARAENFASPGGAVPDERHVYSAPASLRLNQWAISGHWTMGQQALALNKAGGRISCRFHARDLHLVMGPAMRGAKAPFRVLIDGKPPGAVHGLDVDAEGHATAAEQRLHQLIRQSSPITDQQFDIEFLSPGVEAFSFTFG